MVKKNTDCLSCSSWKAAEEKMQVDLKMYNHFYLLASFGFAINPFIAMMPLENDQQKGET